jgi:polyhydroxyalkanoate synthesis repressor PhaR
VGAKSTARTIRKYPNRRLYDTEESRYITLADIRDLVLSQIEFVVIDKKSGEDITRCILLQVICEQEQLGQPILSEEFLSGVIRAYGHAASEVLADHLEQSLGLLMAAQRGAGTKSAEFEFESVSPNIP